MCTAITYLTRDLYFGRTLDHTCSYGEEVTIAPRNFPLPFRHKSALSSHYAMIGMAHVEKGYPLYYDAMNEKGLAIAGLNFEGFAEYHNVVTGKDNIAQFELLPWLLAQCASVKEARMLLKRLNLTNDAFDPQIPPSSLHWLIADRQEAITVEAVKEGLRVCDNPVGVLTNNPPFDFHLFNLSQYMSLSIVSPENRFSDNLPLKVWSRGMGAIGLPGDLSSSSRFVRAAFTKANACSGNSEEESVGQFFHITDTVSQVRGCCKTNSGEYEVTRYTSCCNVSKGIYYYTTYDRRCITAVDLHREDPEGSFLIRYPLLSREDIFLQN